MDAQLASLTAAAVTFVGTHFALSHPLRAPLAGAVGEKGFQAVYSLVALASFAWMVMAFRSVGWTGPVAWDGAGTVPWLLACLLTLVAAVLLVGSFKGNPAMPDPRAAEVAAKGPHGVFHITRHPMMWSFALWAVAHILIRPDARTTVLAGSLLFLALVGAHMQDRKKEVLMGAAWSQWEAQTSYWPKLGGLAQVSFIGWIAGFALWLATTWLHVWLAYVPAGIWRWVG